MRTFLQIFLHCTQNRNLKGLSHEMDLALYRIYRFLRYKIIEATKKFKNRPRPLFRPGTENACYKKPNPSRETVPLKTGVS